MVVRHISRIHVEERSTWLSHTGGTRVGEVRDRVVLQAEVLGFQTAAVGAIQPGPDADAAFRPFFG
jgi:hypothetical protein